MVPNPDRVGNIDPKNLYYNYLALKTPIIQDTFGQISDLLNPKIAYDGNRNSRINSLVNSIPLGLWQDLASATNWTTIESKPISGSNQLTASDNALLKKIVGTNTSNRAYAGGSYQTYDDNFVNSFGREIVKTLSDKEKEFRSNPNLDFTIEGTTSPASEFYGAIERANIGYTDNNILDTSELSNLLGAGTKERPLDFLTKEKYSGDTRYGQAQERIPYGALAFGDILGGDRVLGYDAYTDKSFEPELTGGYTPIEGGTLGGGAINYALKPNAVGETKVGGGSLSMIPSASGDVYYVTSSQNGPQISVASGDSYIRSLDTAKNITPIVNYNTAQTAITNASVINADLAKQAKEVQELITNALVKSVYAGVASQTDRPEYTIENKIGEDLRIFQNAIAPITSLTPITQENLDKKVNQQLTQDQNFATKIDTIKKEEDAFDIEAQKKKDAEELERQKRLSQSQLDIQAQKNAEIEAKKLADAKAAESERLRLSNQFDYDSQIEAALRAAEGNSAFARKQRQNMDANQKIADAEMLDKTKSTGGNPLGYAGGFAEKAIEKSAPTPQSLKMPSFARPPAPPITPVANSLTASSLLPSLEGLQFGGN
jgi:hypothetical protein